MTNNSSAVLMGAVAMASFVAMLSSSASGVRRATPSFCYLRLPFGVDSSDAIFSWVVHVSQEAEPLVYLARLLTFAMIIATFRRTPRQARLTATISAPGQSAERLSVSISSPHFIRQRKSPHGAAASVAGHAPEIHQDKRGRLKRQAIDRIALLVFSLSSRNAL